MRATPLTILATVVAVFMVSGGAYATAATLITGKQVLDHSLTGRDIKNGSMPVYNRPLPFLQEVLRHAASG